MDRVSGGNYVNHDIRSNNGKFILMPPYKAGQSGWGNLALPNVHKDGGDIAPLYPVNTKFVDFDRTFIYGYVHLKQSASVKSNIGLFNYNTPINTCTWGDVAGVEGDTVCPFQTSDLTGYTDAAANLFAGGYMMPRFGGEVPYGCYRIVSNTIYDGGINAGADETDFVIEAPGLQAAVDAAAAYCYMDKNPYTYLKDNWGGAPGNEAGNEAVMGVSLIDPTAETYQWVQTWGPIHMLGGEQAGKAINLRMQYFHSDGTLIAGAQYDPSTTVQHQPAGYLLAFTYVAGGVYGALLQLQLER